MALSTWIDRAARREADLEEARSALDEHFAQYGEPTEEAQQWARDALAAAGVGNPVSVEDTIARQRTLDRLDGSIPGEGE